MTAFTYNKEDANPIVPEGEYDAVVLTAETGETKKGDPKLAVTCKIYDADGRRPLVTDNIVSPYGIRRLKQLCQATGLDFESGEVDPADFVGKNLRVRVVISHDETGQYDDRNVIRAYMPDRGDAESTSSQAASAEPAPAEPSDSDKQKSTADSSQPAGEIPF